MSSGAELVGTEGSSALASSDVVDQVCRVQEVMAAVMKENVHYGKIPGCGDKPTLLQPGAQVLAFTFRLTPSFSIEIKDLPNLHREYLVRCNLASISTGQAVGMGVGSCSTMESKYRYRNVADYQVTGDPIPEDYKARKSAYRKQGYGAKKTDAGWEWVRYTDSAKIENPDIADTYNTVLKVASKRAFVHAVLNTTAASDMFTQDIEDMAVVERPTTSTSPMLTGEDEGAAESTCVVLASEDTLAEIRALKDELHISGDTYLAQLIWAQESVDVTSDEQLTAKAADKLLVALKDKRAAVAQHTADAEREVINELGAEEIKW